MTGTSQTGSTPWLLPTTPPTCQPPEHRGQPISGVAESSVSVLTHPLQRHYILSNAPVQGRGLPAPNCLFLRRKEVFP